MTKQLILLAAFLYLPIIMSGQEQGGEYAYAFKGDVIASSAPRTEGKIYRIELITVRHFNPNDPDLRSLTKLGKLYPERYLSSGTIRLMLGGYRSAEEAKPVLNKVRSMGFSGATLVSYRDGYRQE